jgi:hypothetical protein
MLTLNLLTTTIVAPPSNASKWQMGFNSAFKGVNARKTIETTLWFVFGSVVKYDKTVRILSSLNLMAEVS